MKVEVEVEAEREREKEMRMEDDVNWVRIRLKSLWIIIISTSMPARA